MPTENNTTEKSSETESPDEAPIRVAEATQQYDAYFLHGISPRSWVQRNSLLMAEHADFGTKLEVCLAFRPNLSASTLTVENPERLVAYEAGLVIGDGTIGEVHNNDYGTVAASLSSRASTKSSFDKEDITAKLEKVLRSKDKFYSEITIEKPQFAGLYWRPSQEYNKRETVPGYIVAAAKQFALPLYVIGEDSVRIVTELQDDGTFTLGEIITPDKIKPAVPNLDIQQKQQELLERGVFKVAKKERELLADSEAGRLAYYAELEDLDSVIAEGDVVNLHATYANGNSTLFKIANEGAAPFIEISGYGDASGDITARTKRYYNTKDLSRFSYLTVRPFWIGDEKLTEKYGLDDYDLVNNKEVDLLSVISGYINGMERVIANIDSDPELNHLSSDKEDFKNYFTNVGFYLYGYAAEAAKKGDTEQAERARAMATRLVDEVDYEVLIKRRMANEIGTFILTREDLESA